MVRLGGFLPNFEACASCGRAWGKRAAITPAVRNRFSAAIASIRAGLRVSAATLAMVRAACQAPLDKWLAEEKAPAGCREARHFFEEIIESHTEKKLVTRQMMEEEV